MTGGGRKWLRRLALGLAVLIAGCLLAGVAVHEPRPVALRGRDAEADALARSMIAAVDGDAWNRTGAVRFRFRDHRYLWDRQRDLVEVTWGDRRVLMSTRDQSGIGFEDGARVEGYDLVAHAWKRFCNDTFWLNPVTKMFDEGTRRELVEVPEGHGVLVSYSSGGVTPGDSYLWVPGPDGRPARWQMWVSIIPVGGVPSSWTGWQQLPTGAWISTRHAVGPLTMGIDDVEGAATLRGLLGDAPDPFVAANIVEDPEDTIEW